MFSPVSVISSFFSVQQAIASTSLSAFNANASVGTSAAASQSSAVNVEAAAQTSAQAANTSASTISSASVTASQTSAPAVSASSDTSVTTTGAASVSLGTSVAAGPSRAYSTAQASANTADLDRHFAIGMQKSAGAYAASRLSDILVTGSDASNVAASLEASQKHFQSLVSQVAASAPSPAADDQDETADSASTARVQSAYDDAAA